MSWTAAALVMAAAVVVTAASLWLGRHKPPARAGQHRAPAAHLAVYCARCDARLTWLPDQPALGLTGGWHSDTGGLDCAGIGGGWHAPVIGGHPPMTPWRYT